VVLEHGRMVIDEPSSELTANDLHFCHFGGDASRSALPVFGF
jgi:hypothetical protein